jgi:hypothetical protein
VPREASTKVDARRHARAARFQSPALQQNARAARCQSPTPQRTEQRPRRWTPGGTPARRDFQSPAPPPAARPHGAISIASPSPGGTPARRDFQSPALQRHARAARFPIASPSPLTLVNHRSPQLSRGWSYAHQSHANVSDVRL